MGILYLLTVAILITSFMLLKKSDNKLNFVSWMVLSIVLFLAYNIFVCFVLGSINIHTNLICLSIVNIVFSLISGFFIWKKKEIQKYFVRYQDILGVLLVLIITFLIGSKQYTVFDKTIATASVDGSMHYSAATNFADEMIILSKIDNQTGYNFLTMQTGAYINTGIMMNIVRNICGEAAKDYITFKVFEIAMFALNGLVFYMLIADKLNTKYKTLIGLIFLALYSYAYPYTNLLYGFSYLSVAMTFCAAMLYLAKIYKDKEIDFSINLILILLAGFGIIFSYCLFVPAMFAFICLNTYIFDKEDTHKIFKKKFMWVTGLLLLVTIVGILYLVIPTFLVSTQNKLTDAIGFEGGIYKGLYIDFLFYIPFAILFIVKAIKNKKMNPILLALILVGGQAVLFLAGLAIGYVSSYYYYKIYCVIYILLVYIAVDVMTDGENSLETQVLMGTALAIFVGLILCVTFEIEVRIKMKYPGLLDSMKTSGLVGIYYDTNVDTVRNINASCVVNEDRVDLAEELGKLEDATLKNLLVGGMNTNCKAWMYVISRLNCGGESINDLQVAVVETSVADFLANPDKEYFLLYTEAKFETTENYELVFKNPAGVILKKIK